MNVLTYFLAVALGLYVHEVGHAAVAVLLGFRVRQVSIGSGAVLLRVRLGAAWLVLRALPFDGVVRVLLAPGRGRLATACLILGGVLGNAALFVLVAACYEYMRRWRIAEARHTALVVVGLMQLLLIVLNLLPIKVGQHDSDGLALLNLLRHRTDEGEMLSRLWAGLVLPPGAPPLPATAELPELSYQATSYLFDEAAWVRQDARRALETLLRRPWHLTGPERAVALGALALGGHGNDPQPSPAQLDAWTQEGMALAPTPWMQVARARALAALGHFSEAMVLAAEASHAPLSQEFAVDARLLVADTLARLGNADSALAWLIAAREVGFGAHPLVHEKLEATAASVAATNAAMAIYGPEHALLVSLTGRPGAPVEPPSPDFPEIVRLWTLSNSKDVSDARRQACAALRPLLGHALPVAERAFVLGLLTLNSLVRETGAGDAELDQWSSEALTLAPTDTLRVVRAGALVQLGQHAEGMRLATAKMTLRQSEQALAHLFASQAAARLGEATAAATWLDLARVAAGGEAELRAAGGRMVPTGGDAPHQG